MAQLLVRNVDDEIVVRLKRRAAEKNRSVEAEVRDILAREFKPSRAELIARADALRARTRMAGPGESAVDLIREGREEQMRNWDRIFPPKR
jgi:plasmid stability protein